MPSTGFRGANRQQASRPWVKIENATTEELKAQIDQCPSGALIYRENEKEE